MLLSVTTEEITKIIFSIPKDKSPGPNGFTSHFFKDSWTVVGVQISVAVNEFFRTWKLLKQVKNINITLIPKMKRP